MAAETTTLRTGWEDDTGSDDTLTLAGVRALADRALAWAHAAGGRVHRGPGVVLADAGSPCLFLNVAALAGPVDAAAVPRIVDFFPAGRPFVLASPVPTLDLGAAGLRLMGHPPYLVRPAGGPAPRVSREITVREVTDAAGLAVWDRVLAAGYPTPPSPAPPALLGSASRFWMAYRGGEPVATALSHVAHGVVEVDAVATLPAHRGHGAGAAVTWAATAAGSGLPAVLLASDDGLPVYRRLGYLPVARWTMWFRG